MCWRLTLDLHPRRTNSTAPLAALDGADACVARGRTKLGSNRTAASPAVSRPLPPPNMPCKQSLQAPHTPCPCVRACT
eukprot:2624514-Rhodomonas_salina.2